MFDDASLSEAGERLIRMGQTLADMGDQLDLAVIRFQDHKLYLKVLSAGVLCVLALPSVNLAALRMAVNLVGRRIAPTLEQIGADLEMALADDTVRTPAPVEPPRMRPAPPWGHRGRRAAFAAAPSRLRTSQSEGDRVL